MSGICSTKSSHKGKTQKSRSALFVVCIIFIISGTVRISEGIGQAFAAEAEPAAETTAVLPALKNAPGADALLLALQEREAKLAIKEAAIADRVQALSISETAIEQRLAALEKAEEELAATLAVADKAAEEDLGRLTAVYEAMKPKDAAIIFETMEPEFSAGFLTRMRPETAAAILAGLTAEKAYAVSVVVAGRNSAVPKD